MGHLPTYPTPFIGRKDELAQISALLADPACRLLTLVGPGGIGKTRLALQSATGLSSLFPHGIYFMALSGVGSADLIAPAIASVLPIRFGAEDLQSQIIRYLVNKQTLLIMDNFEHLLAGVDTLTDILQSVAEVKFLVTSRERLNLREEWALALEGLAFPHDQTPAPLERYSAVELFVQRARQVRANFSLRENADAVKIVCQCVEGMPLGIELAVTWLRAMSCRQIAARMESSVDFLATPLRNVPERHRSLRAVFEWSWGLLAEAERDVLMKLSVFRGGFDLDAAAEVAGASLTILAALADKSLIRVKDDGRYDLHELLRQYAADKLASVGATSTTEEQHLDYFVKLAEQADKHVWSADHLVWFDRLEVEWDNLRAALARTLQRETDERGLRLGAALGWFVIDRPPKREVLGWLEQLLTLNKSASASLRAKVCNRAAEIAALTLSDDERCRVLCSQAIDLARTANDQSNVAWALSNLAFHSYRSWHSGQSAPLLEESLELFRKLNDAFGLNHALRRRAAVAIDHAEYAYAKALAEEALADASAVINSNAIAWSRFVLGLVAWLYDYDVLQAETHFLSGLSVFREVRNPVGEACLLISLADLKQTTGDEGGAVAFYSEMLALLQNTGLSTFLDPSLVGLARFARLQGQSESAACLLGAAEMGSKRLLYMSPIAADFDSEVAAVSASLDEAKFASAWATGKAMTREQILAFLRQKVILPAQTTPVVPICEMSTSTADDFSREVPTDPLSPRELEVLHLVVSGYSNQEIAERLVVTNNTVRTHLKHLYSKLNVNSRTRAIAKARELNVF